MTPKIIEVQPNEVTYFSLQELILRVSIILESF